MELNPFTREQQPIERKSNTEPTNYEIEWREKNRRDKENHRKRLFIDLVGGVRAFDYSFENFPRKSLKAYQAATRFDPDRDNLYFWGPSYVGKSHLSTAVAHKYFDLGLPVYVASLIEFKDTLRLLESRFDYIEKKKFIDFFINANVLVLHELGRGPVSEHIQETFWNILERRIQAGRNGLIVTSNFPPADIGKRYGTTIYERIKDLCGGEGIIQFPPRDLEIL